MIVNMYIAQDKKNCLLSDSWTSVLVLNDVGTIVQWEGTQYISSKFKI